MKPMLYTRWLVIAKSNKERVSKDYKRRGNYYSAYEKGKIVVRNWNQVMAGEKYAVELLGLLDSHCFVQDNIGKCDVWHKLDRTQCGKKWLLKQKTHRK